MINTGQPLMTTKAGSLRTTPRIRFGKTHSEPILCATPSGSCSNNRF